MAHCHSSGKTRQRSRNGANLIVEVGRVIQICRLDLYLPLWLCEGGFIDREHACAICGDGVRTTFVIVPSCSRNIIREVGINDGGYSWSELID